MPRAAFNFLIAACLVAGVALMAFVVTDTGTGSATAALPALSVAPAFVALLVGVAGMLGAVRRVFVAIDRWLGALRPQAYALVLAAYAAVLIGYFLAVAMTAGRPLFPTWHDEMMTLLQARMLSAGRVALPQHECAEFFDTFYVLVKPVYASMYFPGAALAYALPVALGLPWAAWPLLIAAGMMLATQLVAARVLGSRLLALATTTAIAGLPAMGYVPTMSMSHTFATLLGMGLVYGWLRWRERPGVALAAACGALAGWLAITRPLESIAFCLPVAVAVLSTIRPANWRRVGLQIAVAVAAAMPFVALMLMQHVAVTGSPFDLPISLYTRQEFVGLDTFDTQRDPAAFASKSELTQKQVMFRAFVAPLQSEHLSDTPLQAIAWRVRAILLTGLPDPLLIVALPLSLLLIRRPAVRVLWAIVVLFVALYMTYHTYLPNYSVQIAPALLTLVAASSVAAVPALGRRVENGRAALALSVLALATLAALRTPQAGMVGHGVETLRNVFGTFQQRVASPALVLIRYDPSQSPHVEPVYNLAAAGIDDNPIVLAHDLGPEKNRRIIAYYAARQPSRNLYYFDRRTLGLRQAGLVKDAANQQ
ncbi:MAG TPA: hypothetical protein VF624_07725 [Tepidisphaeraceae bacterium]|jgi:hypothetical protein